MKVFFPLFFILILSSTAIAGDIPYDKNCVKYARANKWLNVEDKNLDKGHMRKYDHNKIKADFYETQNKLKTQLKGWKKLDSELECLNKIAGIKFEDENLIIEDFNRFETFRLGKSKIDCVIDPDYVEYKSSKDKDRRKGSGSGIVFGAGYGANGSDNTSGSVPKDVRYKILENEESDYDKHQSSTGDELAKVVKQLQGLGDLGFQNYCAHQLYLGSANDEVNSLTESLNSCDNARKNKNYKYLESGACKGYPDYFNTKIPELEKRMGEINDELKSNNSQPLVTLNNADKKIYSQFANQLDELKEARKQAQKDSRIHANDYEFLRSKNMVLDAKDLVDCGGDNVWSNQLQAGLDQVGCKADIELVYKLDNGFKASVDSMKKYHRKALIAEMNIQKFMEAVKAKFNTLPKNEQNEVIANPSQKCSDFMPLKETRDKRKLCSKQFLDAFNKAINTVKNDPQEHFFSLETDKVVSDFNQSLQNIVRFCEAKRNILEKCFDEGEVCKTRADENNNGLRLEVKKLKSHPAASYLLTDAFGDKIQLDKLNADRVLCAEEYSESKLVIPSVSKEDIVKAKKELSDVVDEEFISIVDTEKPDRGGHSNKVGAWACGVDMDEKEDFYVLNKFYYSHPYMMGKVLKNVEPLEQGVYNAMTCDAIECDASVDQMNDNIATGIKLAAMALPLGGIATAAINLGVSSFGAYKDWEDANENIHLAKAGSVTAGYAEGFHDDIKKYLEDNELNADWSTHAVNLSAEIITSVLGVGAGGVGKDKLKFGSLHKMNEKLEKYFLDKGLEVGDFEKKIISTFTSSALSKAQSIATKGVNGNLEAKDFVPSTKEIIIGMSILASGKAKDVFKNDKNLSSVLSLSDIPYSELENIDDPALLQYLTGEAKNRLSK